MVTLCREGQPDLRFPYNSTAMLPYVDVAFRYQYLLTPSILQVSGKNLTDVYKQKWQQELGSFMAWTARAAQLGKALYLITACIYGPQGCLCTCGQALGLQQGPAASWLVPLLTNGLYYAVAAAGAAAAAAPAPMQCAACLPHESRPGSPGLS